MERASYTRRVLKACLVGLTLGVCAMLLAPNTARADSWPSSWEAALRRFAADDRRNSPAKDAVLFVGSSSIQGWPTHSLFPSWPSINRGIGGTHISSVNRLADRIVVPYDPRVIVFYAGDNDISARKSAAQVFADFETFLHIVQHKLPGTRVVFISIKPSLSRRSLWAEMTRVNQQVIQLAAQDEHLFYADVATAMLDNQGRPKRELFARDGLHLNRRGYRVWTAVVEPIVEAAWLSSLADPEASSGEEA